MVNEDNPIKGRLSNNHKKNDYYTVFIVYHPSAFVDMSQIADIDGDSSFHLLLLCMHSYTSPQVIKKYKKHFDQIIFFEDTDYKLNLPLGIFNSLKIFFSLKRHVKKLLPQAAKFNIVSDCSAYLPVNILLSTLKRDRRCNKLISIRRDNKFSLERNQFVTCKALLYTKLLHLFPVSYHPKAYYHYLKEPRDRIVILTSPYTSTTDHLVTSDIKPVLISRSVPIKKPIKKGIVLFFTDCDVNENFKSNLQDKEIAKKLHGFAIVLQKHYQGHEIVCKPHPNDHGKIPDAINEAISTEIVTERLTSQMYLDLHFNELIACYSITSTSLFSSADLGIPSYALYKLFGYGDDSLLKVIFENPSVLENPFLTCLETIDQLGKNDNLSIAPRTKYTDSWYLLAYDKEMRPMS